MESVHIQWLNNTGWVTNNVMDAPVSEGELQRALRNAQNIFPGKRIRAVDDRGRLIDMLG